MSATTHSDAFGVRTNTVALSAVDWGLLMLRLALGIIFFAHGSQKVLGWFGGPGLSATVTGMAKGGIPLPLAYVAAFTEFLGGLGLIFGVLARLSALGIFIVMLVAVLHVHLKNGLFMNWGSVPGKGEGFEYHILAMAIALMVLLSGPGRIAIADLERRLLRKPATPAR